jgi:hypothetical protein
VDWGCGEVCGRVMWEGLVVVTKIRLVSESQEQDLRGRSLSIVIPRLGGVEDSVLLMAGNDCSDDDELSRIVDG